MDAPSAMGKNPAPMTEARLDALTSGATRLSARRVEIFASAPNDPRSRRPIDWIRVVASLLLLIVITVLSKVGSDLDTGLYDVLIAFPGFMHVLWLAGFWLALAWSIALILAAAFSHRQLVAAEGAGASALAVLACAVVAEITVGDASHVFESMIDTDGPPSFPPATLAVTAAVITTMAPYVTLPLRQFGRLLLTAQFVGAMFLGVTLGSGAVAALAIGWMAGSVAHLAAGSPGGFPTVGRVGRALRQLGVVIDDLNPVVMRRDGVAFLTGFDNAGEVLVKVYGRDAWDGELLASIWRQLWYRDSRSSVRLSRTEYVEHEGFMTFFAARAGANVPEVVTAGRADNGDALIVVRLGGTPLDRDDPSLGTDEVDALWSELAILHSGGIAHHRIDLDRVIRHGDGTAGFADLSSATVRSDDEDMLKDHAQLFALTLLASGEPTAIAAARAALGDDELSRVLPYVQEAALPPVTRGALNERDIELDDVRNRLTEALGAEKADLVKLRRVTWGSIFNMALLTIAAYTIIGMLGGIDFEAFGAALQSANWWWLALALIIGQTPRISAAFSTMGSSMQPLPLGPTCALQFATCYINLTVPSSAGRVALTTRYFQRCGVPTATALSAGFIDTLAQTAIQITLFVLIFFASDIELDLSVATDQLSGLATIAMIAVAVLIVAVIVVLCVAPLRRRVLAPLREMKDAAQVLRVPSKVLHLFGGNLGSEIMFATTLAICTRAYGYEFPLSTFILINVVVSLFSSVIPVPGGIGVSEAGLSLGLTRAGVPSDTAFAIALSHRFITFYLPPIWGFMSYKWLIKHRFL